LQNFGYDRNSFAISGLLSVLLKWRDFKI
jgi:hypothetical protein